MPHEVWARLHDLALCFESEFPTRHRLRGLVKQLREERRDNQEAILQEVEYLCLSLSDLLSLAQEMAQRQN